MRRRSAIPLIAAAGGALTAGRGAALASDPSLESAGASTPSQVPAPADMSWWREARFGLFIHWGPVSLKGTEIGWSRGREVPVEEYDEYSL